MRIKKVIGVLLAVVLTFSLTIPAGAAEIDNAKKQAEDLKNKKSSAESEKSSLAKELEAKVKEMEEVENKISAKETEISKKEDELVQAKVDENTQYDSMKKRIKYMYENGNTHFIEILCDSKSIGEFLNNAEYINTISTYDRNMLVEFQDVVQKVEKQEEKLQSEYKELSSMQEDIVQKQESLTALINEKSAEIASLDSELSKTNSKIKKLEEAAAEAQRKQQEAAAAAASASTGGNSSGSGSSSGGGSTYVPSSSVVVSGSGQFTNPCPGGTVSSTFGYRDFDSSFHKGLDLAAGEGTPTYAAAAGTVIIAGWSNSAGNWVVIDHGNGLVTKYMHHSALAVSAGQTVAKGQQIGYVGNTGDSFGAHLHFQVEVNGSAVDPQGYL